MEIELPEHVQEAKAETPMSKRAWFAAKRRQLVLSQLIPMRFHAYDRCRLRISFGTDDAEPSHHCAQETHSPTTLDT
jgi:hypothetical protein